MTLSSLFGSSSLNSHSFHPSPGIVPADRGDISHSHNHGWKGETALSALTLLAFLFFLNLLQNCLRENMVTQAPTVLMMMVPTTPATAKRTKRDVDGGRSKLKGDAGSWSDDQMSMLVSNHVHSHWTERRSRTPDKANAMLHVEQLPHFHKWTETDGNTKYKPLHSNVLQELSQQLPQRNRLRPELSPPKTKRHDSYANVKKWWNVIKLIAVFMRPTARTFICCDLLDCHSQKLERTARKSHKDLIHMIRQGVFWLCDLHAGSSTYRTDECSAEALCTNQLIRTAIANVLTFFEPPTPHGY